MMNVKLEKMNMVNRKTIMKKTILVILFAVVSLIFGFIFAYGPNPGVDSLKEGDVIFHASDSRQAPMLRVATASPITHCGIIIEKGGELYVLEAEGKVILTPIRTFINRGIGKAYCVRRPKKELKGRVKYKQYLGIPYDIAFKFNNKKYYCSELVYDIYKNQFGIQICEPRPLSDYHTLGLEKEIKKRGMKMDQLMVAPSDLMNADCFEVVR